MFQDFANALDASGSAAPWAGATRPRGARATADGSSVGRALDIVVALMALAFFAPAMIVCALAVFIPGGGPILFRQQRLGRDGTMFTCLKFRTMRTDAAEQLATLLAVCPETRTEWQRDHKLRRDPRVTAIGGFLRRTSLDELPQLFNVLAGDMAIVGPRPIITSEIARYGRYISAYCAVRPGITGLWQIKGRSSTTYRRRVACDVLYSRAKTPLTDLRIIACTVPAVVFGHGAC